VSACATCGHRLGRGDTFCSSCGRAQGAGLDLIVEFDSTPDAGGHEFVLAPRHRSHRRFVGVAVVGLATTALAVSLSTGSHDAATVPTTKTATTATTATTESDTSSTAVATRVEASTTLVSAASRIGSGPLLGESTGLGLLVVVGNGTFRIDLDAGMILPAGLRLDPLEFEITPLGLLERSSEGVSVWRAPGRGEPRSLPKTSFLGAGPPQRLWFRQLQVEPRGFTVWYEEASVDRVDVELPRGSEIVLSDGLGGLVIGALGGIYRWQPGDWTPRRFSVGSVLSVAGGFVLAAECDDDLGCGAVVHDLRTGTSRPAPIVPGLEGPYAYGQVASDGEVLLALRNVNGDQSLVAVTMAGAVVDLGEARLGCLRSGCTAVPHWSPDGRWLFWAKDPTTIAAWRIGLDRPVVIRLPDAALASELHPGALSFDVDVLERVRSFGDAG
jgi:hypothetical protein